MEPYMVHIGLKVLMRAKCDLELLMPRLSSAEISGVVQYDWPIRWW